MSTCAVVFWQLKGPLLGQLFGAPACAAPAASRTTCAVARRELRVTGMMSSLGKGGARKLSGRRTAGFIAQAWAARAASQVRACMGGCSDAVDDGLPFWTTLRGRAAWGGCDWAGAQHEGRGCRRVGSGGDRRAGVAQRAGRSSLVGWLDRDGEGTEGGYAFGNAGEGARRRWSRALLKETEVRKEVVICHGRGVVAAQGVR